MRRLWSPALAFGTVGLLGAFAASLGLQLRGGLLTAGLYVLALQLVVSALGLSAVDDLRDTQPSRLEARRPPGVAPSTRLPRALWNFYLSNALPAGLVGCGLAMSMSFIAIGVLDDRSGVVLGTAFGPLVSEQTVQRSELALAALLTLTVLLTLGARGAGRYGWVVGFVVGVVVGQAALVPRTDLAPSIIFWGELAGALMACTALVSLARGLLRRRRRTVPA